MKRIKIAALGAMLLLGIACSKNNEQYEPTDLTVTNKASTMKDDLNNPPQNLTDAPQWNDGVRRDYDVPDPVVTPTGTLVAEPANLDPGIVIGVGNTVEDPATSPARIRMDVRNDEDATPHTDQR